MDEILYADDLVLMSETMEGLRVKFQKWKEAFERKGMKVNLNKTKVMVSGSEGKTTVSKIDPCSMCGKRVKANSVLCGKFGKWVHGRCTKMKRVTPRLANNFVCGKCDLNFEKKVEPVEEYRTELIQ